MEYILNNRDQPSVFRSGKCHEMSQSFSKQRLCTYASSILASKQDLLFPAHANNKKDTYVYYPYKRTYGRMHDAAKGGELPGTSVASTLAGPERAGLTGLHPLRNGGKTHRMKSTDCLGLAASILVVLLLVVVVVVVVVVVFAVVAVVVAAVVSVADFVVLRMYTGSIHLYVSMYSLSNVCSYV